MFARRTNFVAAQLAIIAAQQMRPVSAHLSQKPVHGITRQFADVMAKPIAMNARQILKESVPLMQVSVSHKLACESCRSSVAQTRDFP